VFPLRDVVIACAHGLITQKHNLSLSQAHKHAHTHTQTHKQTNTHFLQMIEDGVKTVIYTHIYMYTQSQTQITHITHTHRTKIIRLCFLKSALHTAPDHCTDPRSEDLSSFMTSARKAMTLAIAPAKKDNRGMKKKKGRGACSENKSKIGRHTDGCCRYATAKRTFPKLQRPSSAEFLEQDEEDEVQDRTMCAVQGDVTV